MVFRDKLVRRTIWRIDSCSRKWQCRITFKKRHIDHLSITGIAGPMLRPNQRIDASTSSDRRQSPNVGGRNRTVDRGLGKIAGEMLVRHYPDIHNPLLFQTMLTPYVHLDQHYVVATIVRRPSARACKAWRLSPVMSRMSLKCVQPSKLVCRTAFTMDGSMPKGESRAYSRPQVVENPLLANRGGWPRWAASFCKCSISRLHLTTALDQFTPNGKTKSSESCPTLRDKQSKISNIRSECGTMCGRNGRIDLESRKSWRRDRSGPLAPAHSDGRCPPAHNNLKSETEILGFWMTAGNLGYHYGTLRTLTRQGCLVPKLSSAIGLSIIEYRARFSGRRAKRKIPTSKRNAILG